MIRAMPDSFDRDDLFERILLIDKVGEGRRLKMNAFMIA